MPIDTFKLHWKNRMFSKMTGGSVATCVSSSWSDIFEVTYTYSLNGIDCRNSVASQWFLP